MSRFDFIKYDEKSQETQGPLKKHFEAIEKILDEDLPEGSEKDNALMKLQESYHWVGESIKCDQIDRLGEHVENTERGTATPKTTKK